MKNLFLIPAALLTLSASAQSLQLKNIGTGQVLAPNSVIELITTPEGNVKANIDFKNTSGSSHTYNVKRYDVLLNTVNSSDAASAYFCFGGSCYGASTMTSPTPIVLMSGKSASDTSAAYCILTADLDEATVIGKSAVKYTFFNVAQTSDSVQVTLKYNSTLGISKNNKDVSSFEIFPNPASENAFVKINATKAFEAKMTLYNSLGAVISEKPANISEGKNTIDLKIETLSPGLYFVNVKTTEASVTKRMIIK